MGNYRIAHYGYRVPKTVAARTEWRIKMPNPWSTDDELRLVIMLGLRKGRAAVRGARRAFTEDEQKRIAKEILDHLRLSNYTIAPGRPGSGHANLMPARHTAPGPDDHD